MLKPLKADLTRLRSVSLNSADMLVIAVTVLDACLGGFLHLGVNGTSTSLLGLCILGLMLEFHRKMQTAKSVKPTFIERCSFSYKTYVLCCAAVSLTIAMAGNLWDCGMLALGIWASLLCVVSAFDPFSAKQWRLIALGSFVMVGQYMFKAFLGLIQGAWMTGISPAATESFQALPQTALAVGFASLAVVTAALVFVGRITQKFNVESTQTVFETNSKIQKLFAFLRRAAKQIVSELPVYAFISWYACAVFFLSIPVNSVGDNVGNWLLASCRDANLSRDNFEILQGRSRSRNESPPNLKERLYELLGYTVAEQRGDSSTPFMTNFLQKKDGIDDAIYMPRRYPPVDQGFSHHRIFGKDAKGQVVVSKKSWAHSILIAKLTFAFGLLVLPFTLIMRASGLYASLTRRLMGYTGNLRFSESALSALRNKGEKLRLKYESRFIAQAAASFSWLAFWYLLVFAVVAFCPGDLGMAITNWLDFSFRDAGFSANSIVSDHSNMRLFMAALLAMYMCGPLAISGCVFLPHRSGRQIIIDEDGISLPDGPFFSMWLRTFRLFIDVKSISLKGKFIEGTEHAKDKRRVKICFRTGGALSFRIMDMPPEDLRVLLERIDEHADDCDLSAEVVALRMQLSRDSEAKTPSDAVSKKGKFKSSIFVPLVGGERIESHDLRVVKVLANKPLSAVYLVRGCDGRLAILKQLVMPKNDEISREHLRIFQRECELMKELQYSGIAKVRDVFEEGQSHFLLLEHFKGKDLKTVVETYGVRRIEEVAQWALSLCDVLEYLHSKNIVHRDITPENIVLYENDSVRLIDFGAAHQFIEGITGTLIGKQSYVAPEQLRGKATRLSDIYSLGVTMNFLLTGKEPIALMQCEPELGGSSKAQLMRSLVASMTNFEYEHRPQSIAEVRNVLLSILDRAPVASVEIPNDEELAVKTIQLMSEALPEPVCDSKTTDLCDSESVTLSTKVKSRQKVKRKSSRET